MTKPYAEVIGDPIQQSKSPVIHNFWLDKLGIDADYRACHVKADRLAEYLAERRNDPEWRGCNVTMPHKQVAGEHLYSIDETAKEIGAVNTIYPAFDRLLAGTNTDAPGFLEPLREELKKQHLFRMARVLGTGGAARAIITALAGEGFTIVLAGRDPAKAQALLHELAPDGQHHAVDITHFTEPTDFTFDDREGCLDLVVNATSLGMKGQPPLPFDISHAPPGSIFYDIVYSPLETELLANARAEGFRTIDGLSMLIGQAAAAFELFFNTPAPREHDADLRELLIR